MIYPILAIFLGGLSLLRRNILFLFTISLICTFSISLFDLPDNDAYQYIYESLPALSSEVVLGNSDTFNTLYGELGYKLLNSFSKNIGLSYYSFRFFLLFFIVFSKLYLFKLIIKDNTQYLLCAISYFSLFFYIDSYVLRQSIASVFICYSLYLAYNKSYLFSFFLFFIAPFFHVSAIFCSPLLFIIRKEFSRGFYLSLFVGIFIVGIVGVKSIVLNLVNYIPSSYLVSKLLRYSVNEYGEALGVVRISVILYSSFFILCVFRLRTEYRALLLNAFLISLLFLIGFNDFGILGERGFRLASTFIPVAMSSVVFLFARKDKYFNAAILWLFFIIVGTAFSVGYETNYMGF